MSSDTKKKYKVYKLIYNDVIVYVGITTKTLEERKKNRYRRMSVAHIASDCKIELIEETDDKTRETFWIEFYSDTVVNKRKAAGFDRRLYNLEYTRKYRVDRKDDEDFKARKKEQNRKAYAKRKAKKEEEV